MPAEITPAGQPARSATLRSNAAPDRHRLLPASTDAEQGLVCSLLLAQIHVGGMCAERGVGAQHFHSPALATIYGFLLTAWTDGRRMDVVTLTQALHDAKVLEQVGGAAFISQLFTFLPTATNASYYLDILEEKHTLREVIRICTEFASRSYEEQDNVQGLVADHLLAVSEISNRTGRTSYVPMKQRVLAKVERMSHDEPEGNYILTGIGKLDHFSPLKRGDMALIVGKHKSGKSFLACSIARHVLRNGGAAFVDSLEQSNEQEIDRLLHGFVGVPIKKDHQSKLSEGESQRFMGIMKAAEWRLDLRDDLYDLAGIIGGIRQAKARWPDLQLAVIDYAQLVRGIRHKGDTREMEIASVSRLLRRTFKEVNCAGLLLAQLNKDGDARESMALEQDMTAMWKIEEIAAPKEVARKGEDAVTEWAEKNAKKRFLSIPLQRNERSGIGFPVSFQGELGIVGDLVNEPVEETLKGWD